MIGITKLLCGTATPGDALRYGRDSSRLPAHLLQFSADKKPIVVWNSTLRCNLRCIHCYASATTDRDPNELTTEEGRKLIDDLAEFGAPVLLFSGGEPLTRPDVIELATYAHGKGLRVVLSTNGNLITKPMAKKLKDAGFSYIGVSLDGIGAENDYFRGKQGAFDAALRGIRNCVDIDLKAGLRCTMNALNFHALGPLLDLVESENINRVCFYHLVYAGRGNDLRHQALSHEQSRAALDLIMDRTLDFHRRGMEKDVLTVDNHCDGVYLYLRVLKEQPERAAQVLQLLRWNGGNRSGMGIASVDPRGHVHPDQFWWHHSLGTVRERKFGDIWMDTSDPIMAGLKDRLPLLKGRCGRCKWQDACGGNFRVRAEAVYNDVWAEDPGCYLTEEEIMDVAGVRA